MKHIYPVVLLPVVLGLAVSAAPATAHHSLAGEFSLSRHLTVTGVMTRVEWTNPHAYVFLDASEPGSGKTKSWAIELPSPNKLERSGWNRQPFTLGTTVTVTVFPAKDGSRRGSAQEIVTPDGRKLFAGPLG